MKDRIALRRATLAVAFLLGWRCLAGTDTWQPVPRDLPLPASPPSKVAWLPDANVLQPYGRSQYTALIHPGDRPERLKKEFGFNAIIVLPTDAHNVAPETDKQRDILTDEQFRAGVTAYRAAGYKLILYTSVMGFGLAPEFQSGQVAREHPDWLQRDPKGNPVMVYGVPWLCPNTGARDYALDRAARIAKEYDADGILLDNNQFFFAGAGWTCHCDSCTKKFREYVKQRFGAEKTKQFFGVTPEDLQIPSSEGPLWALWLNWRNRSWADINESFRARLRKLNSKIMLFANTQYHYDDATLGTDFQYDREDVLISESVGLTSRQMSAKMVLGHALAAGRPLWNYIGTFTTLADYSGMKPAKEIGPLIAATMAHDGRPWIVDGFDLGATDTESRREMSRLLGWHAEHKEFYNAEPWAGVGAVISLRSRNVLHRPLIPPHINALLAAGTPVIGLRDDQDITAKNLKRFHVITVETAGCLPDDAVLALTKWMRGGGLLIVDHDACRYDELGRKRPELGSRWTSRVTDAYPETGMQFGKGLFVMPERAEFAATAIKRSKEESFQLPANCGVEVEPYQAHGALLLHIIRHEGAGGAVTLKFPKVFRPKGTAEIFVPGQKEVVTEPVVIGIGGDSSLTLKNVPEYCVVKVPLK